MLNEAASLRQGYGKQASGVLAILPTFGLTYSMSLCSSKWLRPFLRKDSGHAFLNIPSR